MRKAGTVIFSALIFSAMLGTLFLISCTPESCYENTESAVKAGFYETGTGKNIAADSVTAYGIGMESLLLYKAAKAKKEIFLPLNPTTHECSFVVSINGITDTITLTYSSFPHLISKECGYSVFHTLESYSSSNNIIDTVIIRNPNVTIPYEENIRIFF
jgi:hypothetical protein